MNFDQLRDKHKQFIYEGFEVKEAESQLKIYFDFSISPDIKFRPEIILPEGFREIDKNVLNNLVFQLGLVEMISYWKATCSPEIVIRTGYLNEEQISFWKDLITKGLGEFFYTNKIDFTQKDLVKFKIESKSKTFLYQEELKDRDLILVGGGKDSAVTLEEVNTSGKEYNCLLLNPTEASLKITEISGCKFPIIVKRTVDPKLLELNKNGYLNGHTPFSAYLAFLSTLVGVLYDFKNLVVSNESSASEENIQWLGHKINHQFSKSLEFEKDFKNYSNKYLSTSINYYSHLRSLNELQISEKFSKMDKYHKIFRSCNRGSKQGIWCGSCAKCLSTYLTLYPYLGSKTEEIFGKDLLEDQNLVPLLKALLRQNGSVKPFDCVATIEEIKTAINLGKEKAKKEGKNIPVLLQTLK